MRFISVIVLVASLGRLEPARILGWQPFCMKSHQNIFVTLFRALAQRGHNITYVTNQAVPEFTSSNSSESINQIILEEVLLSELLVNQFDLTLGKMKRLSAMFETFTRTLTYPSILTDIIYSDPKIHNLIFNDHFDLVLLSPFFGMTGYPMAWFFQVPIIIVSPNTLLPGITSVLGDSDHTAYIPYPYGSYSSRMTLIQRLFNTLSSTFHAKIMNDWQYSSVHKIVRKTLPDCPPLEEIEKNVSLVFVNSHPVFNYPRPLPLEVIEIGAAHCRPARALPPDMENFVSASEKGFIVFAIGTAIEMNDMPETILDMFVDTFSQLPLQVVWQWKGIPTKRLSDNVQTFNWLPQQDLLGHKNCRLLLTHGGLNSLQEAVYHRIPVLGFPIGSDQKLNLIKAISEGYAISIDWQDINPQLLMHSIHLLLYDQRYAHNAQRASKLLHDQLRSPLERAVFWTEHVLRNNGTKYLQLGSRHLAPCQRALIDVYALLLVLILIPALIVYLGIRKCMCR